MSFIRRFMAHLRALFGRRALESEMQEEMRAHLEQATARLVARGMPAAKARIEARREIGIRIALGGRPVRVAGAFFASGLRLCAIGALAGLPVSVAAVRTSCRFRSSSCLT